MPYPKIKVLAQIEGFLSQLGEISDQDRAQEIDQFCRQNPALADDLRTILELMQENPSQWEPPKSWPDAWVDPALPPGTRLGAYAIQNCLGMGSMGIVYRAARADGSYQQDVAIKVLAPAVADPNLNLRFQQERHLLASLNHPGIAHILDAGFLASGEPYFVMELVNGLPITEYCTLKKLSLQQRAELFQQVFSALGYAHQRRVIHSDLKPAHLLVTEEGLVKIIDFGIARSEKDIQEAGVVGFTPAYASPEQIRGEPVTTLTDAYSACAILFELFVGEPPFDFSDCDLRQALAKVKSEQPRSLIEVFNGKTSEEQINLASERSASPKSLSSQLNGELQSIFSKGLSQQAEQRYPSIEHLAGDVRAYFRHLPLACMPAQKSYLIRKFFQRHPISIRIGSLIFAMMLILTTLWLAQIRQTYQQRQKAEENLLFLMAIFDQANLEHGGMAHESALDLINRSALNLKNSHLSPKDKSRMLDLLSQIYRQLGQPEPGTLIAEEALQLKKELGIPESQLAINYTDLGALHVRAGHWEIGVDFLNRALVINQNNPNKGIDLLLNLQALGFAYQINGDLAQAEACYQKILELDRAVPQVKLVQEQASLNLSWLWMEEYKIEQAKPLLQSTIQQRLSRYGPLHPATLRAREAWTHYLFLNGEVAEAYQKMKSLLSDTDQAYEDFPHLAQPPLIFASELAMAMGDNGLAEEWLKHGLEQNSLDGTSSYLETIPILNQMALMSAEKGDFTTAQAKIAEAFKWAEKPGIPKRFLNLCLRTRAEISQRQGDFKKAESDYTSLYAHRKQNTWPRYEWLRTDNEYGWLLVRTGRAKEAVALYEQNLISNPSMQPMNRMNCLHNLGWAYVFSGRRAEGINSFREALTGKISMFGANHPSVALSQHSLAWCLYESGKLAEALDLNQHAIETRAEKLGKQHPDYAWSLNNQAIFLYQKGEFAEALANIQEAFSIRKQVLGPENPLTLQSMANWISLLAKNGQTQQAYQLGSELYLLYEKSQNPQQLKLVQSLLQWAQETKNPESIKWQKKLNQLLKPEEK